MENDNWVTKPDEPHLGGNLHFGDPGSFSPKVWNYVIDRFGIESVMDLGSGLGHSSHYFFRRGMKVIAVDGLIENVDASIYPTALHDLTTGPFISRVDLVHCQEVVEHIEERYLDHLIGSMVCGKYILMTHATPGQGGYHHVNEQPAEYWIDHMARHGCQLLVEDSNRIRNMAGSEGGVWFAASGLLFANNNRR